MSNTTIIHSTDIRDTNGVRVRRSLVPTIRRQYRRLRKLGMGKLEARIFVIDPMINAVLFEAEFVPYSRKVARAGRVG